MHIETVGVGTAAGTTVDADGYVVHTALDEAALTEIAETTGGEYHPSSEVADVMDLADSIDRRLTVAPGATCLLPAHSAASRPCCSPWARPAP